MNINSLEIKEVINQYPKVGDLLLKYGVDCVTCAIGTCLLKDVVGIHNFSYENEQQLFGQVEKIINNEPLDIEALQINLSQEVKVFSEPINMLIDEHKKILRMLDVALYTAGKKELNEQTCEVLSKIVFYVKNYADKYHHAKEEDILFKTTSEDQDIIKAMYTEHDMGRAFIADAIKGVENNDAEAVLEAITGYVTLLREHIRKEDKILYPWFENMLSDEQKKDLQSQFEVANKEFDKDLEKNLLEFLYLNYA